MSEYWKSTPKYWCKFCNDFVRDTKVDRQKHEATPKHQRGIQRSLRDLHRGKEREERDAQRAKNEVARLNGLVGGSSSKTAAGSSSAGGAKAVASGPPPPKKASVEDRKRQLQQLADMGIAIPDEYRKDMAMAGDWQTVSVKRVDPNAGDNTDALAKGVRKRKLDENQEEEQAERPRKGWGQSFKTYPGSGSGDVDLDSLLVEPIKLKNEEVKTKEPGANGVKKEEPLDDVVPAPNLDEIPGILVKSEESKEPKDVAPGTGIVFKKRKKPIREK